MGETSHDPAGPDPVDLRAWRDDPQRAGVLVDFDGTLAPIVADPERAAPLPEAAPILARLAETYAVVAVISGRPVAYLARHLGDAGRTELVGLYGMERRRADTGQVEESEAARPWKAILAEAAAAAEETAPPGTTVERKGLAVTLHYRNAPSAQAWAEELAAEWSVHRGLAAHPGKMSVELRPPGATDKGTVVSELAGALTAVCFAGDDMGDLPAFVALSQLRTTGVTTLSVAVGGDETPPEVLAAADLRVEGPAGVVGLLRALEPPAPAN